MKRAGCAILVFASILGLLVLIMLPCHVKLREKAFDASALQTGRSAKLAAEEHHRRREAGKPGYPSTLGDLLVLDPGLADDPKVTFTWGYAGDTNYEFTTGHAKGSRTFVFTGEGPAPR